MSPFERRRRAAAIQDQLKLLWRVDWRPDDAELFYGVVRNLRMEIEELMSSGATECQSP